MLFSSTESASLGVGVCNGAEAATHASRTFPRTAENDEVFLKIRFRNAFNKVRRCVILETVSRKLPELLPFSFNCCAKSSYLLYGSDFIMSEEWFNPGDSITSLFFCTYIFCLRT